MIATSGRLCGDLGWPKVLLNTGEALTSVRAATAPYFEDFEAYAVGDTTVTNFTEVSTSDWLIVSPGIAGKSYENGMSVTSTSSGVAVLRNASSAIDFPALSSSSFVMSTLFRIDSFTLTGTESANTATIGLFARSTDAMPASSAADRYQVSYFLDDDGVGHLTGRLWLREINVFFGDSLNELSAASLPIALGNTYQLTLLGTQSVGSVTLTATLTDMTTSSSISVSDTDGSNLVAGSQFGYFNHVRVVSVGTVGLNADFDNFSMLVPEPAGGMLLIIGVLAAMWRGQQFNR